MLARTTQLALALLLICIGLVSFQLQQVGPKDVEAYEALVESSDPSRVRHPQKVESHQDRHHTTKDLWFSAPSGRLHHRLEAPTSRLVICEQGAASHIREELTDPVCTMQEELYFLTPEGREVVRDPQGQLVYKGERQHPVEPYRLATLTPQQRLRHFRAASGTFHYGTNLFQGEDLELSRYTTASHELLFTPPGEPNLFHAKASQAEIGFGSHHPTIRARQLKAKLLAPGHA